MWLCVFFLKILFYFLCMWLGVLIYTHEWSDFRAQRKALNSQELEFPTESSARTVGALQHDCLHMSRARDTPRDMPKFWGRDHEASSLSEEPQATKNAEINRNSLPWKRVHQLANQHK